MGDNNLTYNLDDFHEVLRPYMARAIEHIRQTPPLGGAMVQIKVDDLDADGEAFDSYAITRSNMKTGESVIVMKKSFFGVGADLVQLKSLLESDHQNRFHGEMTDPGFVLLHEYGHAWLATFISSRTRKSAETWLERIEGEWMAAFVQIQTSQITLLGNGLDLALEYAPSRYALTDRHEFFAEAFAARRYGDAKMKNLRVVKIIDSMVAAA